MQSEKSVMSVESDRELHRNARRPFLPSQASGITKKYYNVLDTQKTMEGRRHVRLELHERDIVRSSFLVICEYSSSDVFHYFAECIFRSRNRMSARTKSANVEIDKLLSHLVEATRLTVLQNIVTTITTSNTRWYRAGSSTQGHGRATHIP